MKDELTKNQIRRQDKVDNAIYWMVNDLIPSAYFEDNLERDIEWISRIRSSVESLLIEKLEIKPDEQDDFEMKFYPYLEGGDE